MLGLDKSGEYDRYSRNAYKILPNLVKNTCKNGMIMQILHICTAFPWPRTIYLTNLENLCFRPWAI